MTSPLHNSGLKLTVPRQKIWSVLVTRPAEHLSAEDIFQILEQSEQPIAIATIYRVLTQFHEAGLIHKHHFGDSGAVYELDDGSHHDHMVCDACGEVEEFLDDQIECRQAEIAQQLGFQVARHTMVLYGLCRRCQKNQ